MSFRYNLTVPLHGSGEGGSGGRKLKYKDSMCKSNWTKLSYDTSKIEALP